MELEVLLDYVVGCQQIILFTLQGLPPLSLYYLSNPTTDLVQSVILVSIAERAKP